MLELGQRQLFWESVPPFADIVGSDVNPPNTHPIQSSNITFFMLVCLLCLRGSRYKHAHSKNLWELILL